MRPIWSGALSFGLINIPVRLYSAVYERDISLHMLHKKDLSPIRFARICKEEEKEVPYEDIVKGYEFQKGEYVVLTEDDFVKANPKKTKTIELQSFVDESEIDPIYFDKSYYLEPDKGAGKVYLLLNEALKKSKRVGLGVYVLHTKEHIGLIKPYGRGLILQQMRFQSEIRNFNEIELPVSKLKAEEVDIAVKLISQLSGPFKPEKFKDTYAEELMALINQKIHGKGGSKKKESSPKVSLAPIDDIMQKLKDSLKSTPVKPSRTYSARTSPKRVSKARR